MTQPQELASALRRYLMADPVCHDTGAKLGRTFRVDALANKFRVEADVVRKWALDVESPDEEQVAVLTFVLTALEHEP